MRLNSTEYDSLMSELDPRRSGHVDISAILNTRVEEVRASTNPNIHSNISHHDQKRLDYLLEDLHKSV
jgi:hypothetical protein